MECWIPGCPLPIKVQWGRRAEKSDDIHPVFACGDHAITLDAAAQTHRADCQPTVKNLPNCGCTPEPLPSPTEMPKSRTLPTGWVVNSLMASYTPE